MRGSGGSNPPGKQPTTEMNSHSEVSKRQFNFYGQKSSDMDELSQLFERKEIVSVLTIDRNLQEYINDFSVNRKAFLPGQSSQSANFTISNKLSGMTGAEGTGRGVGVQHEESTCSVEEEQPCANEGMYFDIEPYDESVMIELETTSAR